jgi:hypothetical protein
VVQLTSDNKALTLPAALTVPQAHLIGNTSFQASAVAKKTTMTITAKVGTATAKTTITLLPAQLASIVFNPSQMTGGNQGSATVNLTYPTLSPVTVTLQGQNARLSLPTTVTIPTGASFAKVPFGTMRVAETSQFPVTATSGGLSVTAVLTLLPTDLQSVSVSPTFVYAGGSVTGTITLTGPTEQGFLNISLTSNTADVTVPTSVTVPANSTSATFTVAVSNTAASQTATIQAQSGSGGTASASFIIKAINIGLVANPVEIPRNSTSTITVLLNSPPSADISISLSSDSSFCLVPQTVQVKAGTVSATFTATNAALFGQSATISAKFGSSTGSVTVKLDGR